MAYYSDHPDNAGTLNSIFNVLVITAMLAFAFASVYFYG